MEEESKEQKAFSMLFSARWNIPTAALQMDREANSVEWERLKEEFREYCRTYPPVHFVVPDKKER